MEFSAKKQKEHSQPVWGGVMVLKSSGLSWRLWDLRLLVVSPVQMPWDWPKSCSLDMHKCVTHPHKREHVRPHRSNEPRPVGLRCHILDQWRIPKAVSTDLVRSCANRKYTETPYPQNAYILKINCEGVNKRKGGRSKLNKICMWANAISLTSPWL